MAQSWLTTPHGGSSKNSTRQSPFWKFALKLADSSLEFSLATRAPSCLKMTCPLTCPSSFVCMFRQRTINVTWPFSMIISEFSHVDFSLRSFFFIKQSEYWISSHSLRISSSRIYHPTHCDTSNSIINSLYHLVKIYHSCSWHLMKRCGYNHYTAEKFTQNINSRSWRYI